MKNKINTDLLVPLEILSFQQKQVYHMHKDGFSNKDIAKKLNLEQKCVATQLSRIRKKAAALNYTYKIAPGAESAVKEAVPNSPAEQLKKKIQEDPGFFSLMFNKYGIDQELVYENKFRLASATQNSELLNKHRVKHIKTIVASGSCSRNNQIVVKIDQETRQKLKNYLQKQKLHPAQTFWDDGSAVYFMTKGDFENLKDELGKEVFY